MGQYFYFYNHTTGERNEKNLQGDGEYLMNWVPNISYGSIADFQNVINLNGWNADDVIIASGDYGSIWFYHKGKLYNLYDLCDHDEIDDLEELAAILGVPPSDNYCSKIVKKFVDEQSWDHYGVYDNQTGGNKVISPLTGRAITYGGTTHKKLIKNGLLSF